MCFRFYWTFIGFKIKTVEKFIFRSRAKTVCVSILLVYLKLLAVRL